VIQNHHHLALQDVGDKMVVMQDGGDLVTILPCAQISLKNGMLPISTKQKLISCATYQKHLIYGNSIVMISFITKKKTKTNRPTEIAKLVKLKKKCFLALSRTQVAADDKYQFLPTQLRVLTQTPQLSIFILYFFAHWAAISQGMSDSGFS
jgi:hypothetical protein